MPVKLLFPGGEHPHAVLGPGANRIGSQPQSEILLDRPGVAPRHCELRVGPQGVLLHVNGEAAVEVNERPVTGIIALRAGDTLSVDGVQMRLTQPDEVVPVADASAAGVDDMSSTIVRPTLPRHALRGVSGEVAGKAFPVVGTVLVGRGQDCHLPFNVAGLSRQHARLTPMDKGIWVEDLGSSNGSFINGRKVRGALAAPGAEIAFDDLRFRVVAPGGDVPVAAPAAAAPPTEAGRNVPLAWAIAGATVLAVAAVVVALTVAGS